MAPAADTALPRRLPTPKHLSPGYFAMVMATGIVAIGAEQRGWHTLSVVLLIATAIEYIVLVILNIWRLAAYRAAVGADLHNSRTAFLFFTFVAGTNVLAVGLAGQGFLTVAAVLLTISTIAWLLLGYTVPWVAVLSRTQRSVLTEANGTWFIWVVAAQSVAVGAATLEPHFDNARDALAILAVTAWSVGVVLYVACAVYVSLRLMVYPFDPKELDPPYWVSMGAIAITVVAGARIVEMSSAPMVDAVRGLVAGLVVVFWCFATWLIPVLTAVGYWRHVARGVPFRFDPTWWSIVFPLGMYAVAGMYLGRADDLPIVAWIGETWMWVAVAAWTVAFIGMVGSRFVRTRR